jgi:hypothetical protein
MFLLGIVLVHKHTLTYYNNIYNIAIDCNLEGSHLGEVIESP